MLKSPSTRGFAGAVVVASATLGPIIPPSIPMVIYALVSGASVGALFLGGVVPGFLMAALMMGVVHIIAVRRNMPRDEPVPRSEWAGLALRGALPCPCHWCCWAASTRASSRPLRRLRLPATCAGAGGMGVSCAELARLLAVVLESTRASAVITLILAGSFMLNYAFTSEGVPRTMAQWVQAQQLGQTAFLLLVNLLFLVLGCFLDVSVLLLVFVPMLLPPSSCWALIWCTLAYWWC